MCVICCSLYRTVLLFVSWWMVRRSVSYQRPLNGPFDPDRKPTAETARHNVRDRMVHPGARHSDVPLASHPLAGNRCQSLPAALWIKL